MEFPEKVRRLSRSLDSQMANKFTESSEELPNHLQWTMSKDIFQKVLSGASWLSKSTTIQNGKQTETQQLLNAKNRNFSYNEIFPGITAANRPHLTGSHFRRAIWASKSNLPYALDPNDPVTISDVCRTATPLIPIAEHEDGVSWVGATFLLINAALGIGILNFPAAYSQAGGILLATIIQFLMVAIIILTMLILAHCSDINQDVTYHDVLMSMCGRKAQKLAAISITCTCYGVCVAIFIIIGDQLDRMFLAIFGPTFCHHWYLERHFTIPVAAFMLVLPICYFKTVDFLRYVGSLGIFAMLYPVFLTVYGFFKLDVKDVEIKTEPDNISEVLVVVPVLCFAYQCQEVVVPVYSCMKHRNIPNFAKSCTAAMCFLIVIYSIIGCFGYLTFGSAVSPNVMKMYNADDPVVMIGIGALIIKMVVTYPVLALCGRGAVDGLYSELFRLSAADFVNGERKRRIIIVSVWFGASLLLSLYTNSIGTVIHSLGAISSANIFIYPGLCLMKVVLQTDPEVQQWKSIFLILCAILLAALGAFFAGIILTDTFYSNHSNSGNELLCS